MDQQSALENWVMLSPFEDITFGDLRKFVELTSGHADELGVGLILDAGEDVVGLKAEVWINATD